MQLPLEDTLPAQPDQTIIPSRQVRQDEQQALQMIVSSSERASAPLELAETLGEGGMGVVRLATQRTLGRQVAVKSLKAERPSDEELLRLMQEAWITGQLEHPNIVPVHDISIDEAGRPRIVLKRISGTSWRELIAAPALLQERFSTTDPLEWHLRTLLQVCRAIEFAHSKGFLHRDLKPQNVMIGEFGEVYVLDWGIAVRLQDDGTGRFPLASDAKHLAGSPAYMAPEMLDGALSEQTDVYLLGATLYEVLSGRPPHQGDRLREVIEQVRRSTPEPPKDAPAELVEIMQKAMHASPKERFQSAAALRQRIEVFLQHRGSARLADNAAHQLTRLLASLQETEHSAQSLYNLYGACQFGFRTALENWPENTQALHGLAHATTAMADYELSHGDPRAAAVLIAQLKEPPVELLARVEREVERRRRTEEARDTLAAIGRTQDRSVGQRARWLSSIIIGSMWAISPLLRPLWGNSGPFYAYEILLFVSATVAGLVLLFLFFRSAFENSAINRGFFWAMVILSLADSLLALHAWQLTEGLVSDSALFIGSVIISLLCTAILERRMLPGALAYLLVAVLYPFMPQWQDKLMSASNFLMVLTVTTWLSKPLAPAVPSDERALR